MRADSLIESFPELSELDIKSRVELIEAARYETFKTKGSNSTWALRFSAIYIAVIFTSTIAGLLTQVVFGKYLFLSVSVAAVVGAIAFIYFQRLLYVRLLSPKLNELIAKQRLKKPMQSAAD